MCEPLEPRQLLSATIVQAQKDNETLFGNVGLTTSVPFEAMQSVSTPFTSTITDLPAHAEVNDLSFIANVTLSPNDHQFPTFTVTVDGQAVPNNAGWSFSSPGEALDGITVPFVVHTANQMTVTITPSGADPSDTFGISEETVGVAQDLWIKPIQTDSSRNGQRPAVLDLVRGDDSGTPQASGQTQDVYFMINTNGSEPGLMGADGNVTPVDPAYTYADYAVTLDGQNGGVSYDPDTGRFKVTMPAGQSSVRVDFVPTNLWGAPGVPAYDYTVEVLSDATDPMTQIGFDFNAATTDPTTQQTTPLVTAQPVRQQSLVAVRGINDEAMDQTDFDRLLDEMSSLDPAVRESAYADLQDWVSSNQTDGEYVQLLDAENGATTQVMFYLQNILSKYYALNPQVGASNNITFALPSWILQGPNELYRVTVDSSAFVDAGFKAADGSFQSDIETPVGKTDMPEIVLRPHWTGSFQVKIIVQPEHYDANHLLQTDGDAVIEPIQVDIIETSPN